MTTTINDRIAELTTARVPFVRALVVRAQEPTSARPGDLAIVLADGTIEGFVGGHCAAGSVRTVALDVLESGSSRLLRVLPDGAAAFPDAPGASVVVNPCLSGGALEIFLEPRLPSPVLHLVGTSPTAEAIAAVAAPLGFVVVRGGEVSSPAAHAVVVASHGGDEAGAVRAALDAGVGFVGLVCSRTRGEAILADLALDDRERACVHPHVGIEIGARTAAEIALSVVAAVVRALRVDGLAPSTGATGTQGRTPLPSAVDPVCGMTVTMSDDAVHAVVDGTDFWFCGSGCRDAHLRVLSA